MVVTVYLFFVIFYSKKPEDANGRWWMRIQFATFLTVMTACVAATGIVGAVDSMYVHGLAVFADVLGYVSSAMVALQYLPQLALTWRLQDEGSLSVVMLLIQAPGTVVWTILLATGPDHDVTTWLPKLATACLQGTLLVMCLIFVYRRYRARKLAGGGSATADAEGPAPVATDGNVASGDSERTPLLVNAA